MTQECLFCALLLQVSQDLVSKFNFVAGMVPILQAYIAEVSWCLAAMFCLLCIIIS